MPLEMWTRRGLRKLPRIMWETGSSEEAIWGSYMPRLGRGRYFRPYCSTAEAMRPLATSLLQQLVMGTLKLQDRTMTDERVSS